MIKEIEIFKFRNFKKGLKISIGSGLTVISGKNGTSKTTLLGMLAKPFKGNEVDIYNNEMSGTFSEIFKINPDYDKENSKTPIYRILPIDNKKFKVKKNNGDIEEKEEAPAYIIKRDNKTQSLRIWTSNQKTAGEGQRLYPVIYLGLKRLYPIAEMEDKDFNSSMELLTETEKKDFIRDYKRILNIRGNIEIDKILDKKSTKNSVLVKSDKFGGITNSSGQDNIGQIIGAIYSYKRLKNNNDYNGGLLIIDEIESSLHPDTQINIINYLIKESKNLNIQVIISTHSFEIIEYTANKKEENKSIKIHYLLKDEGGEIKNEEITPLQFDKIRRNLYNYGVEENKKIKEKINIFYEDEEAKKWGRKILGTIRNSEYSYNHICLNLGWAHILAISEYINGIKVLDSDANIEIKNINPQKMILKLPMNFFPEKEMYTFLEKEEIIEILNEKYNSWELQDKIFENQYNRVELVSEEHRKADDYKEWYKSFEKRVGIKIDDIIKLWIQKNKEKVEKYRKEINELIKDWPKNKK